jgi:threonine dehydrogenase-like Zn-dependent dehydrogenase
MRGSRIPPTPWSPYAAFNPLDLPPGGEHENDCTMLSDIFPTGWHGTRLAGLEAGATVAVFSVLSPRRREERR